MQSHINIFRRISLEIPPLVVTDSLNFLDAVKFEFSHQPDVYVQFLDIMKDFKEERCAPTLDPFLDAGPLCAESTRPA